MKLTTKYAIAQMDGFIVGTTLLLLIPISVALQSGLLMFLAWILGLLILVGTNMIKNRLYTRLTRLRVWKERLSTNTSKLSARDYLSYRAELLKGEENNETEN